jgi:FkbM family methyltransferase
MRFIFNLPIIKRVVPSILRRVLKFTQLNEKFWKIKDINFFLNFSDPLDRKIILLNEYEKVQFNFLVKKIKNFKSQYFLDIGANSGYYSFFIAKKFKKIKVLSFEPNPTAYVKFEKTLKKNKKFKNRVILNKFGLGNKSGSFKMVSLFKDNYAQPGGSSLAAKNKKNSKNLFFFTAKFKALDAFFKIRKKALALKIDVEGNEDLTLKGMSKLIDNNKIILQIEIFKENYFKINNFLVRKGFKKIFKHENDHFYIKNF